MTLWVLVYLYTWEPGEFASVMPVAYATQAECLRKIEEMEIRHKQRYTLEGQVAQLRKGGATEQEIGEFKRNWTIAHGEPTPKAPYGQCWEVRPPVSHTDPLPNDPAASQG